MEIVTADDLEADEAGRLGRAVWRRAACTNPCTLNGSSWIKWPARPGEVPERTGRVFTD